MLLTITFLVFISGSISPAVSGVTSTGINYQDQDASGLDKEQEILDTERLLQAANEKARMVKDELLRLDLVLDEASKFKKSEKLKGLLEQERALLDKLISLNADNPNYKFDMALLNSKKRKPDQGLKQLQINSPLGDFGSTNGHLFLANYVLQKSFTSAEQRKQNLQIAEQQINNCLFADGANVKAKELKAFVHDQKREYFAAYKIYKELFETDASHFQVLARLADTLEQKSDKESILQSASERYRKLAAESSDEVSEWVKAWQQYLVIVKLKGDLESFAEAETAIRHELTLRNNDVGKQIFLKRVLSRIFSDRAISRGRSDQLDVMKLQLNDLAKALENDEQNSSAKQWLTILSKSEIGELVRKTYDPDNDQNASWIVLSELGNQAMQSKDYDNAVKYFQRVQKLRPTNPQALNNLAYAYLVSDTPNAEQALLLVDQAIAGLIGMNLSNNKAVIASFYDTRGVALMQLDRKKEAADALEIAVSNRPENIATLKKLINCYESFNEKRAEEYRQKLKKIESANDNEIP